MIGRLKQLLILPQLADEEARKARLVKYSLVLACGMNTVFLFSVLSLLPGQINLVMIALAIAVVLIVSWWLLRRGYTRLVVWLLVASAGTLTTTALFTLGPGYSSNYGAYLIIALFTGLMIGPRWVPVTAGIGLISWLLGLFIFESGWITPLPHPVNTTYRAFADTFTFIFSSALIYRFTRSIQHSLIQAQNTAAARQQVVEELHRTTVDRSFLENILQSMAEMLLVLDMKGQIMMTNQALLDRLGYEESELIGRPSTIVIAPDTTGRTATDSMIGIGFTRRIEQIYLTKNGIPIPVSFSGRMLRSEDGRIQGVVCVAQDI
ncbi:MAG: PAS domain S-box protein, partial [Anaerolineae bacterium]|nr:PAS domain S-box protein [Anaerolineae bacterium]